MWAVRRDNDYIGICMQFRVYENVDVAGFEEMTVKKVRSVLTW